MDQNARLYDAVLRIHDKIDAQAKDILDIKVAQESTKVINTRLKLLEKIVYGMVAFVLVAFLVAITDTPKKSCAEKSKAIIEKVLKK